MNDDCNDMNRSEVIAVVQKVVSSKRHGGLYVVTTSEEMPDDGSITFSVDDWEDPENLPIPGTCVVLGGIFRKRAGWRARRARFLRPGETRTKEKKHG